MIAQIAVAQHSAVHFDHGFEAFHLEHHAADHNTDNNDDSNNQKSHYECPEYLLTKSMQHALLGDVAYAYAPLTSSNDFVIRRDDVIAVRKVNFYNSRAPPAFLI